MDIIEFLGHIVFFYLVFKLVHAWFWYNNFKNEVKERVNVEIEKIEKNIKIVYFETIEQNGLNTILMYDDNDNFVAQGSTKEEAIESAQLRYPNQSLATFKTENINESSQSQRAT
jgi:hypothetical protein